MALFAGNKLYTREVKDPDTGEIYHVKLRKFDEGYREQRSDMLMNTREDTRKKIKALPGGKRKRRQREQITEYNLGSVRLSDLEFSIKDWDFVDENGDPVPVSIGNIKGLDTLTADRIWDHIEELQPHIFNPEDEEEEEVEYEDADEDEEAAASNGHAVTVTSEPLSFGHDEGPKESAEAS